MNNTYEYTRQLEYEPVSTITRTYTSNNTAGVPPNVTFQYVAPATTGGSWAVPNSFTPYVVSPTWVNAPPLFTEYVEEEEVGTGPGIEKGWEKPKPVKPVNIRNRKLQF